MRREKDHIGGVNLPDSYPFGINTYRSGQNFAFSDRRIRNDLFASQIIVKKACAIANKKAGLLDETISEYIIDACDHILDNLSNNTKNNKYLPDIHPFQGGAGTSVNMASNELIANIALKKMGKQYGEYSFISPLDHVNLSQSTNDTFSTAVRITLIRRIKDLHDNTERLLNTLQEKEREFSHILKIGRTELQDAMPLSLGQEFGAYADAVGRFRWRLNKAIDWVREVNITGTAVGTGINADAEYSGYVIDELRNLTQEPVTLSRNLIDATQNADQIIEVSGMIKTGAVTVKKMSSDLRLLSSGPNCGLSEIILPPLQAGSSIMPGKTNPVMLEAAEQICIHIISGDNALSIAASESNLELVQFLPYIADVLLCNTELFSNLCRKLSGHLKDIKANISRINDYVESSYSIATLLSPIIGYDKMTELVDLARNRGRSIIGIIREQGIIDEEKLNKLISPRIMATPGLPVLEDEDD